MKIQLDTIALEKLIDDCCKLSIKDLLIYSIYFVYMFVFLIDSFFKQTSRNIYKILNRIKLAYENYQRCIKRNNI